MQSSGEAISLWEDRLTGRGEKTTQEVFRGKLTAIKFFIGQLLMAKQQCSHTIITGTKGRDLSLGDGIAKVRDKAVYFLRSQQFMGSAQSFLYFGDWKENVCVCVCVCPGMSVTWIS